MALQDQCTPDDLRVFLPEPPPIMVPHGLLEELLLHLTGCEFKVALYLLNRSALSNYHQPGWDTLAGITAGTRERRAAVGRALIQLAQVNVVVMAQRAQGHVFRFNASAPEPAPPVVVSPRPNAHARLLARLAARDGRRCLACGCTDGPFEADHIVPRSKGGSGALSNRQMLCAPCNRSKGARTIDYRVHDDGH